MTRREKRIETLQALKEEGREIYEAWLERARHNEYLKEDVDIRDLGELSTYLRVHKDLPEGVMYALVEKRERIMRRLGSTWDSGCDNVERDVTGMRFRNRK